MAMSFTLRDGVATVRTFFRVATEKAFPNNPELVGRKRPDAQFSFTAPTTGDDDIDLIVTEALAAFGKKLIADKSAEWDYVPAASELTIAALATDIRTPSDKGNRILSVARLTALATRYVSFAHSIGLGESAAAGGQRVIREKFAPILQRPDLLTTFIGRLAQFSDYEFLTDDERQTLERLVDEAEAIMNPAVSLEDL